MSEQTAIDIPGDSRAEKIAAVFEEETLASLGVGLDSHGKMPDVVVCLREKNWLVLTEATSTHGPVDHKRYRELNELFRGSTAGLVFISALPSRFLGPYG
ncbi:BsuBI/PstI family type II restriction endonuclease [Streptomyces decoyicus]|uniref:BsuBI/PstI family type II restriction endonuclease n=1 Tax=Streptomyces decoyicus TaxID=249567 RepID=UPI0036316A5A